MFRSFNVSSHFRPSVRGWTWLSVYAVCYYPVIATYKDDMLKSEEHAQEILVSQMTAMFMGHGAVSLSDSIRESLTSAIRAEFDMQKQELIASFNREKQEMLDSFALKLAAKENEIAMLRGRKQDDVNDPPATSSPQSGSVPPAADKDAHIKQLEQQNANLKTSAYGQHTESGKYNHGDQQNTDADTLDLNGENVPDEKS